MSEIGALVDALAKAQSAFPRVLKDREAKIQSTRGQYSYRYADLASLIDAVRKPLADNGLAVVQLVELGEGHHVLVTRLLHTSGVSLDSRYALANHERPQEMGSEITYARRYTLAALLLIASEDDDDGGAAQQSEQRAAPVLSPPKAQAYSSLTPSAPVLKAEGLFATADEEQTSIASFAKGNRTCPACDKPTIRKGAQQYGGGWFCSKRDGGCGAKWPELPRSAAPVLDEPPTPPDPEDKAFLVGAIIRSSKEHGLTLAEKKALAASYLGGKSVEDCADLGAMRELYLFLGDAQAVATWRKERA